MTCLEGLGVTPHRGEPLGSSPLVRTVGLRKRLGAGSRYFGERSVFSDRGSARVLARSRFETSKTPLAIPLAVYAFIAGKIECLNMAINQGFAAACCININHPLR